jgi:formiminoglutamase
MKDGSDPRIADLLGHRLVPGATPRVAIIGFPTHEGVVRNGGRAGAAAAPAEIRRALGRLTPDAENWDAFVDVLGHAVDTGDVAVSGDLEADQARLGQAVAHHLLQGTFPIVLGGGHETAFGHFLGYVRAKRPTGILNWDAHADVRELKNGRGHSGSPFHQALVHPSGLCRRYFVAGLLPHSVARAHLAFIDEHKGGYKFRRGLTAAGIARLYAGLRMSTMVTFDIDAVDQSQAPGVSAPATGGMTSELWLEAAYRAGRSPKVTSCDLVEVCPPHDCDNQTARLGALTVWSILRGLAERRRS